MLTTIDCYEIGDKISIMIKEFSDQTPISCIIHRRVEWGEMEKAAGVGV